MPAATSNSIIGRDRRGRSTADGASGLPGGISSDASLRITGLNTARKLGPGAIGHHGEGLPSWWRLGPSTRGSRSYLDTLPIVTGENKRWLMMDFGLVAALLMLCLALGSIVS
jgi:hypothetical protein